MNPPCWRASGSAPPASRRSAERTSRAAAAEWSGRTRVGFSATTFGSAPASSSASTASTPPKKAAKCSGVKPSGVRARISSRVAGEAAAELAHVADRRDVGVLERRRGRQQRVERRPLAVVERDAHGGRPLLVRGDGQRRVVLHERADLVRVPGAHGGDELLCGGHQRMIPQTRSVTSAVKATSRSKLRGTPAERSPKAIVPSSRRTR